MGKRRQCLRLPDEIFRIGSKEAGTQMNACSRPQVLDIWPGATQS
jgi:hypothetical protein